jgi:hypothetical protein
VNISAITAAGIVTVPNARAQNRLSGLKTVLTERSQLSKEYI